jgi:hypothetical protein
MSAYTCTNERSLGMGNCNFVNQYVPALLE